MGTIKPSITYPSPPHPKGASHLVKLSLPDFLVFTSCVYHHVNTFLLELSFVAEVHLDLHALVHKDDVNIDTELSNVRTLVLQPWLKQCIGVIDV